MFFKPPIRRKTVNQIAPCLINTAFIAIFLLLPKNFSKAWGCSGAVQPRGGWFVTRSTPCFLILIYHFQKSINTCVLLSNKLSIPLLHAVLQTDISTILILCHLLRLRAFLLSQAQHWHRRRCCRCFRSSLCHS